VNIFRTCKKGATYIYLIATRCGNDVGQSKFPKPDQRMLQEGIKGPQECKSELKPQEQSELRDNNTKEQTTTGIKRKAR